MRLAINEAKKKLDKKRGHKEQSPLKSQKKDSARPKDSDRLKNNSARTKDAQSDLNAPVREPEEPLLMKDTQSRRVQINPSAELIDLESASV